MLKYLYSSYCLKILCGKCYEMLATIQCLEEHAEDFVTYFRHLVNVKAHKCSGVHPNLSNYYLVPPYFKLKTSFFNGTTNYNQD